MFMMASRMTGHWRSTLSRASQHRSFASSTTPKLASMSGTVHSPGHSKLSWFSSFKLDMVPVYTVFGMVTIALVIGIHSAKQQLAHSPVVNLNKKRRESIFEVEEPDLVVANSDKFVNKSFLRKVAHIQENRFTLPDPSRPDPFLRPRAAETLKTVGVNPRNA